MLVWWRVGDTVVVSSFLWSWPFPIGLPLSAPVPSDWRMVATLHVWYLTNRLVCGALLPFSLFAALPPVFPVPASVALLWPNPASGVELYPLNPSLGCECC